MDFLDELQDRIIPGDGAMGTLLMERGVPLERCFEELCVSAPDTIRGVHRDYIAAGARVIETNSFGANAVRLARHGLEHRVSELNWAAAQLARECARGKSVYVAGSVVRWRCRPNRRMNAGSIGRRCSASRSGPCSMVVCSSSFWKRFSISRSC